MDSQHNQLPYVRAVWTVSMFGFMCMNVASAALCADKLSPFKFYQYFLTSVTDGEVVRFLRMLTFLPLEASR